MLNNHSTSPEHIVKFRHHYSTPNYHILEYTGRNRSKICSTPPEMRSTQWMPWWRNDRIVRPTYSCSKKYGVKLLQLPFIWGRSKCFIWVSVRKMYLNVRTVYERSIPIQAYIGDCQNADPLWDIGSSNTIHGRTQVWRDSRLTNNAPKMKMEYMQTEA